MWVCVSGWISSSRERADCRPGKGKWEGRLTGDRAQRRGGTEQEEGGACVVMLLQATAGTGWMSTSNWIHCNTLEITHQHYHICNEIWEERGEKEGKKKGEEMVSEREGRQKGEEERALATTESGNYSDPLTLKTGWSEKRLKHLPCILKTNYNFCHWMSEICFHGRRYNKYRSNSF